MLSLIHKFNDFIVLDNKKITLNLAYDYVLKAYEILDNTNMEYPNKILKTLGCFGVKGVYTTAERAFLLEKTLELVGEYSQSIDRYNYKANGGGGRAIDYAIDTGLIYSAFLQSYGIDLFEQQGKLHWVKFITLLNNMPDDTRLSKVMGYRVAKIPPVNIHNRAEVLRLRELRDIYRLEEAPEKVQDKINNTLSSIFSVFGKGR